MSVERYTMVPVKRSQFKGMFAPIIRDVFDLGLRNDVIDGTTNHQTAGWKGLHPSDFACVFENPFSGPHFQGW